MAPGQTSLPEPPKGLVYRTGYLGEVPFSDYERISESQRLFIDSILPSDWNWSGKRVLDFGCGVGRTLRQFAAEAQDGEFWGCDIHAPSIEWAQAHLCPPFRFLRCQEQPALAYADGYFDLIYAWSVYTHITEHWAGWLLEHRRLLKNDGLLLVSFLGEGLINEFAGESWDEDRIGMYCLNPGASFDQGGPNVFHSPWWLRAHWGRAFEILELRPHAGSERPAGQGLILMRPNGESCSLMDLERLEPNEPREISALQHQASHSIAESRALQAELDDLRRSRPSGPATAHLLLWQARRIARRFARDTPGG
jgi:SAM-dependent methyltransferase